MQHLDQVRDRIWNTVQRLSDGQMHFMPEGQWSVLQVLEHLFLIESSIAKRISQALREEQSEGTEIREKPVFRTAERSNKVESPAAFVPIGEFKSIEIAKDKLNASRRALFYVYNKAEDPSVFERVSAKHPVFGELSLKQWFEFVGYHEERHLQQLEELIAKVNAA